MKKILVCCLSFILFFLVCFTVCAKREIEVYINGEQINFDVEPINIEGRILVPFRGILEALGAEVEYVSQETTGGSAIAIGKTRARTIFIAIGKNTIDTNSHTIAVDVPAQIINGRTMVPIRVVSECMGAEVNWNGSTQTVTITAQEEIPYYWNEHCSYYGDVNLSDNDYTANGYGTIYKNDDESIVCSGYFKNDYIVEGSYHYSDGSSYYGEFSDKEFGVKHGKGNIYFEDYSFINGSWENDVLNGKFTFYSKNKKIEGNAVNGKWNGTITTYFYDEGTSLTELYKNGEKVVSSNAASEKIGGNTFVTAKFPLYLYSNDGRTYLGKLTTNKYDDESIFNEYGKYGSKYSTYSIFNEYGTYGSKYSNESAFNEYASNPPIIVDSEGEFICYLTADEYNSKSITYLKLLSILKNYYQ